MPRARGGAGYCNRHYLQVWKFGAVQPDRVARSVCAVEACGEKPRTRRAEWCEMHYGRWRRNGDPGVLAPPLYGECVQCRAPVLGRKWLCSVRCEKRRRRGFVDGPRWCHSCGVDIREKRSDAIYCSPRCMTTSRNGRVKAAWLARRDGPECRLCGCLVDLTIRWYHPACGTVDHIVPMCQGGTNERSNLQLAHAMCNFVKPNGPRSIA